MWWLKEFAPQSIIYWRLGCLEEPFAVTSVGLMTLLSSAMRAQSQYQGFGVGLTRGGRLRAQALPHSCRIMSKHIQLWENRLAAGDQSVSQTWQGACPAAPPPCCHHSSAEEPWQEGLGIPPSACSTFRRPQWVAGCFPLPYRELEASADWPTDIKIHVQALLPLALGALTLCSLPLIKDLAPDLCCELLPPQGPLTCPVISGPEALFCKSKTGSYPHAKKMTDYIYF